MIYACEKHLTKLLATLYKEYPAVIVIRIYYNAQCNIGSRKHNAQYILIPISNAQAQELVKQYMPIYYTTTLSI
jgi:hypothetical protein